MTRQLDDVLEPSLIEGVPHRALRGLVERYQGYRYDIGRPGVHRGLPSSAMTVVLAFDQPLEVGWLDQPQSRDRFWAMASGLHVWPAEIHHHGLQFGIQLDITPIGARRLLGVPMGALAADLVPLDTLFTRRAAGWYDHVARQQRWIARFAALDRVLLGVLAHHPDEHETWIRPELRWVWTRMERHHGREPVAYLAEEIGWSRRHLTEQFRAEFGLAPKQLSRVLRFQRSRSLYGRPDSRLADIAAECGYADQAHLTREWQALAGYSPRQWRREELPFLQDLQEPAQAE